jgi:hypothetical protein
MSSLIAKAPPWPLKVDGDDGSFRLHKSNMSDRGD